MDSPLEFQIQTGLRHIKRGRNRDDTAKVDKSFLPILPCWLWRIQSFVGLMAHSRGISSRLNTLLMCLSVSYTFLILHGALYFLFFSRPKSLFRKKATFLLETAVLTRTTRMMENKIGNPSMSSPVMRTLVFLWIQLDTAVQCCCTSTKVTYIILLAWESAIFSSYLTCTSTFSFIFFLKKKVAPFWWKCAVFKCAYIWNVSSLEILDLMCHAKWKYM